MREEDVIVFDFETTGGSPRLGDRPIEIGAVRIENRIIVDRFQRLMNPGFTITSFIESLTGIANEQVAAAPPCEEVMEEFVAFMGTTALVAHNAAFDRQFLDWELENLNRWRENSLACSMLISRRVYPGAPNHKLSSLVDFCGLPSNNVYHRALEDAEKTAYLWVAMCDALEEQYGLQRVPFSLMATLQKMRRQQVPAFLQQAALRQRSSLFDGG